MKFLGFFIALIAMWELLERPFAMQSLGALIFGLGIMSYDTIIAAALSGKGNK